MMHPRFDLRFTSKSLLKRSDIAQAAIDVAAVLFIGSFGLLVTVAAFLLAVGMFGLPNLFKLFNLG